MTQCAATVKKIRSSSAAMRRSSCSTTPISTPRSRARSSSKYRNSGQTCVCANRIFVQDGVYDVFADRLSRRSRALKVGDGLEPGVGRGR